MIESVPLPQPRKCSRQPPDWLRVVPWAELSFGWVVDRVGPLLLKKQKRADA